MESPFIVFSNRKDPYWVHPLLLQEIPGLSEVYGAPEDIYQIIGFLKDFGFHKGSIFSNSQIQAYCLYEA